MILFQNVDVGLQIFQICLLNNKRVGFMGLTKKQFYELIW